MAQPAAWPSAGVLAVSKLQVPGRRSGLVRRDALVRMLAGARHARFTLVSAPPGAGKTTLLAEWHAEPLEERPFAWLSLDPDDSDPVRFWSSASSAARTRERARCRRTRWLPSLTPSAAQTSSASQPWTSRITITSR